MDFRIYVNVQSKEYSLKYNKSKKYVCHVSSTRFDITGTRSFLSGDTILLVREHDPSCPGTRSKIDSEKALCMGTIRYNTQCFHVPQAGVEPARRSLDMGF